MANLSEENNIHKIKLDTKIYSIDAIKKAAFEYSKTAWINIITEDENQFVNVFVQLKERDNSYDFIKSKFLNHILDHQIRIDISKEFKTIREMIIAQAFEPCDNLKEVLSHLINEK